MRDADGGRQRCAACWRETVRVNRVVDGTLYLQVSRGARPRDFLFPPAGVPPTARVHRAQRAACERRRRARRRASASRPCRTSRWARCDIKTVMLLPASLAKEAAKRGRRARGVVRRRGWLRHRGRVEQRLDRRCERCPADPPGRQCHPARRDAHDADRRPRPAGSRPRRAAVHAWRRPRPRARRSSRLRPAIVTPVVAIDGVMIGDGKPGPIARRLQARLPRRRRGRRPRCRQARKRSETTSRQLLVSSNPCTCTV